MIGFMVYDEFLDLLPGFKIPMVYESGLFSDEVVLNGISSLPVTFPFTAKNKRLLKGFNLIEDNRKNLQIDCKLFIGGNFWCLGKLTVSVRGEQFDADFAEVSSFATDADKKLRDIFDENDFIYLIEPYKRHWALNFTINLSQPFYYVHVYVDGVLHDFVSDPTLSAPIEDLIDQVYDLMMADSAITSKFNLTRVTGSPTFEEIIYIEDKDPSVMTGTDNYNIVCPWHLNSVAYGDPTDWLEYQKTLIRSAIDGNVSLTYPDAEFCLPTIKNPDFYGTYNSDFTSNNKIVNQYEEGYKLNLYTQKYRYTLSPQLFLFALLKRLAGKYSSTINGSLTEITDIYNRAFVYNNFAIDLVAMDGYYTAYLGGAGDVFNVFSGKIFIRDHVPDVTLKEFLTTIKTFLGCGIFYRNRQLSFETCKSILVATEVKDWTKKSFRVINEINGSFENGYKLTYNYDGSDSYLSQNILSLKKPVSGFVATFADLPKNAKSGLYYVVLEENKVYLSKGASFVSNTTQTTWSFYSKYLHEYLYENAEKEINTGNSPTLNEWHITSARKIFVPYIYHKGSSNEFDLGFDPTTTRLLFYWGINYGKIRDGGTEESPVYVDSTDTSVEYPYATIENTAPDGSNLGELALKFHGEYGLYEHLYKEWLFTKNKAKELVIEILLYSSELLQLNLKTKIQIGPSQFLISKINFDAEAEAKLVPCKITFKKL